MQCAVPISAFQALCGGFAVVSSLCVNPLLLSE